MKKLQKLIVLTLALASPLAMAGTANPLSADFIGTIERANGTVVPVKGITSFTMLPGDIVTVIKGSLNFAHNGCAIRSLNAGQFINILKGGCGKVGYVASAGTGVGTAVAATSGTLSTAAIVGVVAVTGGLAVALNNSGGNNTNPDDVNASP